MNLWCPIQSWLNFNNFKLLAAVLISHFDSGNYFTFEALCRHCQFFKNFISDIFKLFFRIFSFLEFQFCADIAKLCHIELIWETYESMMPDSIVIEASIIRSSFKKFLQTLANMATLSWFGKLSKCLQDISKF